MVPEESVQPRKRKSSVLEPGDRSADDSDGGFDERKGSDDAVGGEQEAEDDDENAGRAGLSNHSGLTAEGAAASGGVKIARNDLQPVPGARGAAGDAEASGDEEARPERGAVVASGAVATGAPWPVDSELAPEGFRERDELGGGGGASSPPPTNQNRYASRNEPVALSASRDGPRGMGAEPLSENATEAAAGAEAAAAAVAAAVASLGARVRDLEMPRVSNSEGVVLGKKRPLLGEDAAGLERGGAAGSAKRPARSGSPRECP